MILIMKFKIVLVIFSLIAEIVSILIVKLDTSFAFRWYAFSLYLFSLVSMLFLWIQSLRDKKVSLQSVSFFGLFLILILAIITRLYLLTSYPFVSIGDELRDGGLDALRISLGEMKNIFTLGNYDGYGKIIPVLSSFFYNLFGSSVLTYRISASIVSIFDIFLLYMLLSYVTKNKIAS